nr:hypothetical protein Q903MT_gene1264 [Picea sitchensis]QHR92161.1 hypothetical protein Q903MT_gene6198 [Picea sitchensis]
MHLSKARFSFGSSPRWSEKVLFPRLRLGLGIADAANNCIPLLFYYNKAPKPTATPDYYCQQALADLMSEDVNTYGLGIIRMPHSLIRV